MSFCNFSTRNVCSLRVHVSNLGYDIDTLKSLKWSNDFTLSFRPKPSFLNVFWQLVTSFRASRLFGVSKVKTQNSCLVNGGYPLLEVRSSYSFLFQNSESHHFRKMKSFPIVCCWIPHIQTKLEVTGQQTTFLERFLNFALKEK